MPLPDRLIAALNKAAQPVKKPGQSDSQVHQEKSASSTDAGYNGKKTHQRKAVAFTSSLVGSSAIVISPNHRFGVLVGSFQEKNLISN